MKKLMFFLLIFSFFCCKNEKRSSVSSEHTSQPFSIKKIESPVGEGGEPNLFSTDDGRVYMSWVEYADSITDVLMFSQLVDNQWTTPKEISRGSNWFVNWADFPSVVAYKNNHQYLAAHWLQKRSEGTYDYDIYIAQSKDGGNTWHSPFIIHKDGIAAEHGFVTLLPTDDNKIFATWLDGRNTKTGITDSHNDDGHGHGGGAMTLRTATFDINGNIFEEAELDDRICDCCQTTATFINGEPIVAYRDRSEEEVRDIFFTKKTNGKWSTPQPVHADNWKIAGCPVNGPFISNYKNNIAIAWYNSATKPMVNVAFSNDNGLSFQKPIQVDDGSPLGRVGIVLLENEAYVTWLEQKENSGAIRMAKVTPDGKQGKSFTVAETSASRGSGFPQIAYSKGKLIFAWTEELEKASVVKTGMMEL